MDIRVGGGELSRESQQRQGLHSGNGFGLSEACQRGQGLPGRASEEREVKMTGRGDPGQIRSGQLKDSGLHSEMGGFPGEGSRNTSCH